MMKKLQLAIVTIVTMFLLSLSAPARGADTEQKVSISMKMYEAANKLPQPFYVQNAKRPETKEQRSKRIKMIMDVIELKTRDSKRLGWSWSDDDLAWAVFVKTWYESGRYRWSVHAGKWRGDGGRSVCLGQIMNGGSKLIGVTKKPTELCIQKVVGYLIMHQQRCLSGTSKPSQWNMSIIFAGYGTGYSCSPHVHTKKIVKGKTTKYFWAQQRGWLWWKLRNTYESKSTKQN